ncbi:MAG: sulfatase-like hydrolase/transferase, partial [Bacteroidaceae bacterium]|nr:sulfatase-like hydrolase/transferase [Bacteroidaceae bacterium]
MNTSTPLLLASLGTTVLTGCSASKQHAVTNDDQRPNVILLVADDIGYGDLSPYGEPTVRTPQVQRLADRGLRFTNAHAVASTSTPSRYSLLTGHYSWRRPDTGVAAGNAGMIIRPEQQTVADLFKQRGYATGAVGKWHLGLADKTGTQDWNGHITPGPSDIGFDYSYIMAATGDRVPCVWVENEHVVDLDPSDPIAVSYRAPFEGEPLGKTHPELLTKLRPSPNHGHDQAIVNGISRIGYMRGGRSALWHDENIADSITTKAV